MSWGSLKRKRTAPHTIFDPLGLIGPYGTAGVNPGKKLPAAFQNGEGLRKKLSNR